MNTKPLPLAGRTLRRLRALVLECDEVEDLYERAIAASLLRARRDLAIPQQPSRALTYFDGNTIHVCNVRGELAAYKVSRDSNGIARIQFNQVDTAQ